MTPLLLAARAGHSEVMAMLLEKGRASVAAKNKVLCVVRTDVLDTISVYVSVVWTDVLDTITVYVCVCTDTSLCMYVHIM